MKKDEGQKLYDRKEEDFFSRGNCFSCVGFFFLNIKTSNESIVENIEFNQQTSTIHYWVHIFYL